MTDVAANSRSLSPDARFDRPNATRAGLAEAALRPIRLNVDVTRTDARAEVSLIDALPLLYIALPSLIYLGGWIEPRYGVPAALLMIAAVALFVPHRLAPSVQKAKVTMVIIGAVAFIWSILGGVGHFVYANFDWTVRDAVLLDLVQKPWPVVYDYGSEHLALLLRAPTGLYLPAAVLGKLFGIRAAELAMLVWIVLGVLLTFMLMLRDEVRVSRIVVRLAVFVLFSGMDIVGWKARGYPVGFGTHIEWWAHLFQYPAMTTQLFWAPGHALPAWLFVAWLLGRGDRRLPIPLAIAMIAFVPFWSPLAAIGTAPILAVAMAKEFFKGPVRELMGSLFDLRAIVCVLISLILICPYLVLGSDTLNAGFIKDVPWVGEEFGARYLEFVVIEFALFAVLLLCRFRFDGLLIAAIVTLSLIPIYFFGPANDLALRASNPGLAVLAIRLGQWLATPRSGMWDTRGRVAALVLLGVGAVTPCLEVSRLFTNDRWDMNTKDGLIEAAHGRPARHYLTPRDQPWPDRFFK